VPRTTRTRSKVTTSQAPVLSESHIRALVANRIELEQQYPGQFTITLVAQQLGVDKAKVKNFEAGDIKVAGFAEEYAEAVHRLHRVAQGYSK
jgi:hypothetical protein